MMQPPVEVSAPLRILIHVTPKPESAMLIRRAKRLSDFLGAECFAVTVHPSGDLSGLSENEQEAIDRHLNFARNLHIETRIIEGHNTASTLVDSRAGTRSRRYFSRGLRSPVCFQGVQKPPAANRGARQGDGDCHRVRTCSSEVLVMARGWPAARIPATHLLETPAINSLSRSGRRPANAGRNGERRRWSRTLAMNLDPDLVMPSPHRESILDSGR